MLCLNIWEKQWHDSLISIISETTINLKLDHPPTNPFNNCTFELLPLTRFLPPSLSLRPSLALRISRLLYTECPKIPLDCTFYGSTDNAENLFLSTLKRWKMNRCGIKCRQATWEFEKSQHFLFNTNKIFSSNNIVFK